MSGIRSQELQEIFSGFWLLNYEVKIAKVKIAEVQVAEVQVAEKRDRERLAAAVETQTLTIGGCLREEEVAG